MPFTGTIPALHGAYSIERGSPQRFKVMERARRLAARHAEDAFLILSTPYKGASVTSVRDLGPTLPLQADLFDALESALVVTDCEGNILLWNRAAECLYGFHRDRMQGANVMQLLVSPENTVEASDIMSKVLAGESWTGVFPVVCADGSHIRVRITNSPVIQNGQVVAVAGLAEAVNQDAPAGGRASAQGLSDLAWALAEIDGLRTAMKTRGTIEQAKGVLMATRGIDAATAFEVLRDTSQRSNRKLVDVAREIVDRAATGRAAIRAEGRGTAR